MAVSAQRYTAVAIVLLWAIAFAIAFMIPLGWWMHSAMHNPATVVAGTAAFQLHKSIGLTVLALSLLRLAWRLANPPPPLPAAMPAWEKFAALATHWLFYAIIIAMPLTGWLYVSSGWSADENHPLVVTTYWFHLFRVPPLFDLLHQSNDVRRSVAGMSMAVHEKLAWGAIALAALHVAAALKHQFKDRDEVLAHMVPGLKAPNETAPPPKSAGRNAVLGAGFAAIAAALVAALYTLSTLGGAAAPPAQAASVTAPRAPAVALSAATTAATATTANTVDPHTATTPPAGAPAVWTVNPGSSFIGFAAIYTDENGNAPFTGRFDHWRAEIRFDPANLAQSSAVVTIEMNSVHDFGAGGEEITDHRTHLQSEQWLNWDQFATAVFRTASMRHLSGDNYEARGTLTLKGHAVPVTLPFTLTITGAHASMSGHLTLNRTHADIGNRDVEGTQHVLPAIQVNVHVEATRG